MVLCYHICSVSCSIGLVLAMLFVSGGHGQSDVDSNPIFSCNYENETDPFCGYIQDTLDDFDWTRHAGSTATENTGPMFDHTYGSTEGFYIYTESSRPRTDGHIARLLSPVMPPSTTPLCLAFYYQMNGEDIGKLRVLLQIVNGTDDPTLLQQWSGHQDNKWLKSGITIPPQAQDYQIVLESEVGESYRGDVAIDDLMILDKVCPLDSFTCDFETRNLCGFIQDTTDDFDFWWISGGTGSGRTGPKSDNTYKNASGHYVFIEASVPQRQGHVARLISPMIAGHGGRPSCMIFYYHMYGSLMGDLNVHIKNSTSDDIGDPVWSISGNRGDRWRAAEVIITTPYDYQVIFEAERGETYRGDISLDDVNITFTECPGKHHVKNFSSVSCDFEEVEICYYEQNKDDQFDWAWSNRGTRWRFTGPQVDHTLGNELGFFMYIEASWYTPRNGRARLTSPEVPAQRRPSCLEFWYHMYGTDVEELNVYIMDSNGILPGQPDWTQSGDQGDFWHRATLTINKINRPFKIVFEGKRGVSRRDDVALDDIQLYKSRTCPPFTTDLPPATTTPRPLTNLQCTFEQDDCSFIQAYDDVFDWVRHQGTVTWRWWFETVHKDHTLGNSQGHFMVLQIMEWWNHLSNDFARTLTPLLQGFPNQRCLSFWFILNGRMADFLNVYIVKHGQTLAFDPDLVFFGDHGLDWQQAFLDIPPSTYPFYIVFEGTIGYMWATTETAIDDIMLLNQKCIRPTPTAQPISADCNFEDGQGDGMCNYIQKDEEEYWWHRPLTFRWQRNVGRTSTVNTGPPYDHTFMNSSGYYLFAEASQPQRPGDQARITTPPLASSGERMCLQFFYFMTGDEIGSLTVYWSAPRFEEKSIFQATKLADRWQSAYVEIKDIVDDYQISFEAVVGSGSQGDIGIDDIRFLRQPCSGFEPESMCGFDKDFETCFYRQGDADLLEWIWYDSLSFDPSPFTNSSDPVGSFLYIKGDTKVPSDTAVLYPPRIPTKAIDHCLSYDVTVQNDLAMKLVVALEYQNSTWRTLQTVNTTNAPKWTHFDLNLDLSLLDKDLFQIKFITYFGNNKTDGIIAVDNITISQASCNVVKARTAARENQKRSGGSRASVALGVILTLVIIAVIIMLAVAYFYVRRSGFGDSPLAIKYKNRENDNNPVSLPGEAGIANPVYDKPDLANA
ncbi:MAM and LDL-receptor class A domain-containing protein 1-like [Lytechinus pictus]|uniref:MAM and LDL-receptor class A domain-containing protein 1-like n=1 Tax=Lytechinus pictus TaxID=7653 RepID=UPI0030BA28E5